jgi:hypothetical protein
MDFILCHILNLMLIRLAVHKRCTKLKNQYNT